MKFLMYFLMAINAQRYTSLLNRANQKRQRQKPVTETQRPMYYGNSYSHEPHGQRNSNSYGLGGGGGGGGADPCGGNSNIILRPGQTSEIRSPKFPHGVRNLQRQCSWNIQTPMGSRIKLKFDEFRLNTNSADYCTGAHLELRDDYMGAGTNFKICKNSPGVIVTKRNQIQLTLQNGPTGNLLKQGFVITLQATREPMTSNIPPYGQSLITMTQLKAVSSYDYPETDYYQEEVYDYAEEYIYEEYYYNEAEEETESDNTVIYQSIFLIILLIGAGILTYMIYRKQADAKEEREYVEKHSGQLPGV